MYTHKLKLDHDTMIALMGCSGSAIRLYLFLASEQIESCWPWVSCAERALKVHESTVRRAYKELYTKGLLESGTPYECQLPKVVNLQFFYR
jgi:predicted DNA-binding transcriptional regulator